MKKYSFDVKMTTKDMFAFLMRQQYFGFRGVICLVLVAIIGFELVSGWGTSTESTKAMLFLALALIIVYVPVTLLLRAKTQIKTADRFKNDTTHYDIDEKGITISQGKEEIELKWGHLFKYSKSTKRIYVYTTSVSAIIFPREVLGKEACKFLLTNLHKHTLEFGTLALQSAKRSGASADQSEEQENE